MTSILKPDTRHLKPVTHRDKAFSFVAAYDQPGADRYEKHVARIARRWLSLMHSRRTTQGLVNNLLGEFADTPPADYGCAWEDLKDAVIAWAKESGWLEEPADSAPGVR
jgi:hypothetical protein